MAFTERTDWVDDPDAGPTKEGMTPVRAEDLLRYESGLAEAHKALDDLDGHKHPAGDITSGTFAAARIPTLPQSKVSGLADALEGFVPRAEFDALAAEVAALKGDGGGDGE